MLRIYEAQSIAIEALGIMMPRAEPVDPIDVLEKELLRRCKEAGIPPSADELSKMLAPVIAELSSERGISIERASEFCLLIIPETLEMSGASRNAARRPTVAA